VSLAAFPPERLHALLASTPAEDAGRERRRLHPRPDEIEGRRLWAAVMLASSVEAAESILRGRPVLTRQLDPVALQRALRGGPLPEPEDWIRIRAGHLDAVAEAGPFA
jgi:hypothetical protein